MLLLSSNIICIGFFFIIALSVWALFFKKMVIIRGIYVFGFYVFIFAVPIIVRRVSSELPFAKIEYFLYSITVLILYFIWQMNRGLFFLGVNSIKFKAYLEKYAQLENFQEEIKFFRTGRLKAYNSLCVVNYMGHCTTQLLWYAPSQEDFSRKFIKEYKNAFMQDKSNFHPSAYIMMILTSILLLVALIFLKSKI